MLSWGFTLEMPFQTIVPHPPGTALNYEFNFPVGYEGNDRPVAASARFAVLLSIFPLALEQGIVVVPRPDSHSLHLRRPLHSDISHVISLKVHFPEPLSF